jgi:hypothetical protein
MPTAGKIAGTVREGATPVAACTVRLYDRTTGNLISSQSTGAYGEFLFSALDETQTENFFVVALDPAGGTQYNAMIYDRLTPVTDLSRSVSASGIFDTGFGVGDVSFGDYANYIKGLVPLAYWRLKETSGTTFADEMGFAPLTAHGTFLLNQPSALFDGDSASVAYGSAGTNDFLGTGKITGLVGGATGYSILAHVKLANSAGGMSLLAWRNYTDVDNDYIYGVLSHDRTYTDDFSYESWSWPTPSTRAYALGVSDDRWHMTVLTYTAADNTMRLYIDGYLVDTKVQGTPPPSFPNSASVTLFDNVDGVAAQATNCSMSEVAVFDKPLTATQVMMAAAIWAQKTKLNPNDKAAGLTLSNSDMTATSSVGDWGSVRATHRKTTGRWYWETVVTANPSNDGVLVGLAPYTMTTDQYPGQISNSGGIWARGAAASQYYAAGSAVRSGLAVIPVGAVIGHVYDVELGTHDVYLNGAPLTSYYGFSAAQYPAIAVRYGGSVTAHFKAFTYPVPDACQAFAEAEFAVPSTVGWNPADKNASWKISAAKYIAGYGAGTWGAVRSTLSKNTGRRYFEVTVVSQSISGAICIGVADAAHTLAGAIGRDTGGWGYTSNRYRYNSGGLVSYGATYATNDIVGVLVDFTSGSIEFFVNGTSQGVAYTTGVSGTLFPAASATTEDAYVSLNVGDRAFAYTPPTGFVAWNT